MTWGIKSNNFIAHKRRKLIWIIKVLRCRILLFLNFFGLSDEQMKCFQIIQVSISQLFDQCALQRCITDDRAELSSIEWLPSIVWYIIAIEIVHTTYYVLIAICTACTYVLWFGLILVVSISIFLSVVNWVAFHISRNIDLSSFEKFLCNMSLRRYVSGDPIFRKVISCSISRTWSYYMQYTYVKYLEYRFMMTAVQIECRQQVEVTPSKLSKKYCFIPK